MATVEAKQKRMCDARARSVSGGVMAEAFSEGADRVSV